MCIRDRCVTVLLRAKASFFSRNFNRAEKKKEPYPLSKTLYLSNSTRPTAIQQGEKQNKTPHYEKNKMLPRTSKKLNPERHLYFNLPSFPSNRCRKRGVQTIPFFYTQVISFFLSIGTILRENIRDFVNNYS